MEYYPCFVHQEHFSVYSKKYIRDKVKKYTTINYASCNCMLMTELAIVIFFFVEYLPDNGRKKGRNM